MKNIRKAYEQYKHLDVLLSDERWMFHEGHPPAPQRRCLYDLWQAIKKDIQEKE